MQTPYAFTRVVRSESGVEMASIDWGNLLFGFNGRINRAKFWLAVLVYVIVDIIVALIKYANTPVGTVIGIVAGIAIFISGIAVALKRLHDRDRPGWWLLVFYFAPSILLGIGILIGIIAVVDGSFGSGGIIAILFYLAGIAVGIWALVELGCLRGTIGPNAYGPDPLGTV
jgi:uncharacterized membrane protein YhaH (DUF805 family)